MRARSDAVRVELENAGTIAWGDGINARLPLAGRSRQPDRLGRPPDAAPPLAPGERATVEVGVRAPIPPGPYRLAFDLVAERRAWFSELGSPMLARDVRVADAAGRAERRAPGGGRAGGRLVGARPRRARRGLRRRRGRVEWAGGLLHPRPRALADYEPGPGRIPGFGAPLLCPSVLAGHRARAARRRRGTACLRGAARRAVDLRRTAAIVLRARPRSGRRPA